MKKSENSVNAERLTAQDQTDAYLFIGHFMSDFANLEHMIEQAIINYFRVDITLNAQRVQEIYSKNRSITSIMEYSILGSKYFSLQMKIEMIKAIIQERTPQFYAKHGIKMFSLLEELQKLRNIIAHYKTYVYNKEVFITKPVVNTKPKKSGTLPGGIIPDPIGVYETEYKKEKITKEKMEKLYSQISFVINAISFYAISQSKGNYAITLKHVEDLLKIEPMYEGGVNDIKLIK